MASGACPWERVGSNGSSYHVVFSPVYTILHCSPVQHLPPIMAYYLAIVSPQDAPLYEALLSTSKNPSSLIPASSSTGLGGGAATTVHSFPAWSTITMGLPAESKAILEKAAEAEAKGEKFDPFPESMLGGPGSTSGAAAAGRNELGVEMHMLQMIAFSSLDSVEDVMTGNGSQ